MEARKRELEELSRQQQFRPSDEVSTYKIIKGLKELLAMAAPIILGCEEGYFGVVPETTVIVASLFGLNPLTAELIARGGQVRILVTNLQYTGIQAAQELLDIGVELRCLGEETAIFGVWDKKNCISGIHWELTSVSLDQPLTALFTDDPTYAQYLESTFEMLWEQAIPAKERIQELLTLGPPRPNE